MTNYFGFNLMGKVWAPREVLNEAWMERPVHPTLTSAVRSGNSVVFKGHEIVDSFGHFGMFVPFSGASFRLDIFVDGVPRLSSSFFPFLGARVSVPTGPASVEVRMSMQADPSWSVLAKDTATSITVGTDATVQGELPLPLSNYGIDGLNHRNRVLANGQPAQIEFAIDLATPAAGGIQVKTASVQSPWTTA